MSVTRAADAFYTYRFLSIFTTKWTDMDAYKLGIIDENGKSLKKTSDLRTVDEKNAFTLFHRLAFNLKRLLETLPLGRTRMANWVAALALLREESGMSDEGVEKIVKSLGIDLDIPLQESYTVLEDRKLSPGYYTLSVPVAHPKTGEIIATPGSRVFVSEDSNSPYTSILGIDLYQVEHLSTRQTITVSAMDIYR
jgi:hypothetical protein